MKRLTNYIIDLGRAVAYHPGLRPITGSITATVLLSQFIYWIDKTKSGWIYKDSYDIEVETGLSVYEQQTARKALIEKGILSEEYKRLDHKIAFRVNEDVLNDLWEEETRTKSKPRFTNKEEEEEKPIPIPQPVSLRDFQDPSLHPDHPAHNSAMEKKGDLVDAFIDFAKSPGARKEIIKNEIIEKIEKKLHINVSNKGWKEFIEYVYTRQERHNEPIDKFINWMLENESNPKYWTPQRFQMFYPQAFVGEQDKIREDFVEKPPEHVEENYAEMPEHLKKKKKLY
jgi:hypothetical protein